MARTRKLDALLEELAAIRRQGADSEGAVATLRDAIGGRSSHAAARAAEIVEEEGVEALEADLVAAFERFMKNPVKADPGCRAKTAIVDALQALDAWEADLYLRAARHVQLEPVWGGRQDTAPALRGAAGRGLVRMNHPEALLVLADLLADPELPARTAAARAIGQQGADAGLPLLRLKVHVGDEEPEVIGDCLLSLLRISSESSLAFVAGLLEAGDATHAELAALALGESRLPEALPALTAAWERTADPVLGRAILLGVGMLRSEEAIETLLRLVETEPGPNARDVIAAFELYRNDDATLERLRTVVRAREDADLLPAFEELFG